MSSLAQLAPELLDSILSHVSAIDVLLGLQMCGDRALNALIARGGVRELTFQSLSRSSSLPFPSERLSWFPRLTSFNLDQGLYSYEDGMSIVRNLPSTLTSINWKHDMGRSVWVRSRTPADDLIATFKDSVFDKYVPEDLSQRFPQLRTCLLGAGAIPTDWPESAAFYFVAHLPRSVTRLRLIELCNLPISVWNVLPPHLELLDTCMELLPAASQFPSSLYSSLRHLSLDIHPTLLNHYLRENPPVLPSKAPPNATPQSLMIQLPPNLTSLYVTRSSLPPPGMCPPLLTSLTIRNRAELDLKTMLEMLPQTVTHLAFNDPADHSNLYSTLASPQDFPHQFMRTNMRHLNVSASEIITSSILAIFFTFMPNLEILENERSVFADLNLPSLVKSVKSMPKLTCLNSHLCALSFRLMASFMPQLTYLEIQMPGNDRGDFSDKFDFGLIPPLTQTLVVHTIFPISDHTLYLLPKSVTKLHVTKIEISGNDLGLNRAVFYSSATNQPACIEEGDIIRIFDTPMRFVIHPSLDDFRFELVPISPPPSDSKAMFVDITVAGVMKRLFRSMVEITIRTDLGITHTTSLGYSTLTTLNILRMPSKFVNLASLTSLKTLSIDEYSIQAPCHNGPQRLPPNLTSFKTHSRLELRRTPDFDFPVSLTELKLGQLDVGKFLLPLSNLTSLSFTYSSPLPDSIVRALSYLPAAHLVYLQARAPLSSDLVNRFTNLQVWENLYVTIHALNYLKTRITGDKEVKLQLKRPIVMLRQDSDAFVSTLKVTKADINDYWDGKKDARKRITMALRKTFPFATSFALE